MTAKEVWNKVFPILKNKYILAGTLFLVVVVFLSQNNLLERFDNMDKLRQLKKDEVYYNQAIKDAEQKMDDLMNNKESLEKFAREEYLMKKPDEDIFIIVEEKKTEE